MNLDEEIRDGYTISKEMKRLWAVQMDLARKLLDVCRKHNLRIWADSGTLLGVVRHKGHIPWDDDMDFMMLREDYDKLAKLADEFEYPYFLQNGHTEPGYDRFHMQLRNSTTTCILPADIWREFNQGVFIDIFVLDFVPGKQEDFAAELVKTKDIREKLRFRNYGSLLTRNMPYNMKLLKAGLYCVRHGFYNLFCEAEQAYRNMSANISDKTDENGRLWAYGIFTWAKCPLRPSIYSDTEWLPFEDMELPVPKGWDERLRAEYGQNYMMPSTAPSCHGSIIFDTERPYTEVLRKLRKKAGWKIGRAHVELQSQ